MPYVPIIIPVQQQVERDCIVVQGKKYCEDTDITAKQFGGVLLGAVILLVWAIGATSLLLNDKPKLSIAAFLIPPLLLGLALLFGIIT